MLECLLLLLLTGLALASRPKMGLANPFQIYFFIWLAVFAGFYIQRESFISVSAEFLEFMMLTNAVALFLLAVSYSRMSSGIGKEIGGVVASDLSTPLVTFAQVVAVIALYFVYKKAVLLAGGRDVFSVAGYVELRRSLTGGGGGFGYLSYVFLLAFVLASIQLQSYLDKSGGLITAVVSIATAILYAYFSTGRTFFLLLASMVIFPLVMRRVVRVRGLVVFALIVALFFMFVAMMTRKGITMDGTLFENAESFLLSLRSYTVAPVLALYSLFGSDIALDFGLNSFRFFVSLLHFLGLSEVPPADLIRGYVFVPDPTNVYTVYEVYFRDFGYVGLLVPPLFLVGHWWLYARSRQMGGIWVFWYSVSLYPLVMQFFQDQYFSLLSMWIQIFFWYWLLLRGPQALKRVLAHD